MDQQSFRKLLHAPGPSAPTPAARSSLCSNRSADAPKPAFKPRTLKKHAEGPYRDRASERRQGLDSDYAQVEALADDFDRAHAENADRAAVQQQRRFLGGDSAHTVLVKGLDLALLEQNRARAAADAARVDDVALERAFHDAPKKRTREELVLELKSKRARPADPPADADPRLEEAKKAGKFRPIGSKPVGGAHNPAPGAHRKKSERRKKRNAEPAPAAEARPSTPLPPHPVPAPAPEPVDPDFDIFAGAGEYTGVDLGDDDDDSAEGADTDTREDAPPAVSRPRWIATDDDPRPRSRSRSAPAPAPAPAAPLSDAEDGEGEERPMRLQPLASSALPSIRELLALDAAADKGKRRVRKGKGKNKEPGTDADAGGGKVSKDKVERDYKRLKAYTDKKAAGGKQ